jgi:SAM-dependent methyltransferase
MFCFIGRACDGRCLDRSVLASVRVRPDRCQVTQYDDYFQYLQRRSFRGALYRRLVLFPRLGARLRGRTLDLGCGLGDFLRFRPGTIGVDVNPRTVAYCREQGLEAYPIEPDHLCFEPASFDSVLLDNVLEHIEAPAPLLAEIARVLRPGGVLLVGVPGIAGHAADPDHKVCYDETRLRQRLEASGFTVDEVFFTPLWRSSWLSRVMRQYCLYARARLNPSPAGTHRVQGHDA